MLQGGNSKRKFDRDDSVNGTSHSDHMFIFNIRYPVETYTDL